MADALEYISESVLMAVLAPAQTSGGPLEGIEFRHHIEDEAAALDVVVFRCTLDTHEDDGVSMHAGEVEISFASGTKTKDEWSVITNAIEERIYTPALWPTLSFPELGGFILMIETAGSRSDGEKMRRYVFTVPMKVKFSTSVPPDLDLYLRPGGVFLYLRPEGGYYVRP